MKIERWICVAFFVLTPYGVAFSAEDNKQAPANETEQTQSRECNSCTLRHQALLKKKKQREKKALEDAAAAKTKAAE